MMEALLDQTGIQAELMSHKEQLRQQPTVIKIGGSLAKEQETTFRSVAFLREIGMPLVLVHGGGPEIDRTLAGYGIPIERKNGLRVTNRRTRDVVVEVMNRINCQMVEGLNSLGVKARGFNSFSGLLRARLLDSKLGYVGVISHVDTNLLNSCLEEGVVPVIAPVAAMDYHKEEFLNTNGDSAAGSIAACLEAGLVLATDVPGVRRTNGILLRQIDSKQYLELCKEGTVNGGMILKIQAGLEVMGAGGRAVICSGQNLLQAFLERPRGTMIVEEVKEQTGNVEKARLKDASLIQELVHQFAKSGAMLERPLTKICESIQGYFVCRGSEGEILGCAALQPMWSDRGTGEIRAVAVREDCQGRGIGNALVKACLKEAKQLGLPDVFLLTYKPEFFGNFGFKQVDAKVELPWKVWGECPSCPKSPYPDCGEVAMIRRVAD